MRARRLRQSILTITQIIAISVCLSVFAQAQAQTTPTPPPTTTPGAGGRTFSENLKALMIRAADLLPIIQNEIEGPLIPWLERIAWYLAALIFTFGFARMLRENAGAGVDLFWWFGRAALCLALMGSGSLIIDRLAEIGQVIAVGEDGSSPINRFYIKQRNGFDYAYVKFSEGAFTVNDTSVQPVPGGVLGVLFSTETSIPNATRKLDKISRDMSLLYDGLSFARAVISFGDFFLMMIGSFLVIAMRLVAPVMIALAIDRSIAQKVTYPYAWGVAVLTLIWPAVAIVIKGIAYLGGNLAMALGDNQRFYQFDQATMQIIHNSQQNPVYTVLLAAMIMLIAGLSLWGSPYIAYQLSVGRVYEGVSTTISSWVGQLVGAGVEYYSSSMAASISRQAETTQAQGVYFGEVTRASEGKEASDTSARANKIRSLSQTESNRVAGIYAADAAKFNQQGNAEADFKFAKGATKAEVNRANKLAQVTKFQQERDLSIGTLQQLENMDAQNDRRAGELSGGTFQGMMGSLPVMAQIGTLGGNGTRAYWERGAYTKELDALNNATIDRYGNLEKTYERTTKAHEKYGKEMSGHQETYKNDRVGVAEGTARISKEGVNRSAGIASSGSIQGYNLDLQANRINYAGAVKAATQVRDASIEAARLRSVAAVVSSVGHNIARDMEQGLTLRY